MSRIQTLLFVSAVLIGVGLAPQFVPFSGTANAQGTALLDALRSRLQELELRVDELEKTVSTFSQIEDARENSGPSERSESSPPTSRPSGGEGAAGTRIQAPFSVVSANGSTIFEVVEWGAGDFAGGAYVYNPAGQVVAVVGPLAGEPGGRVVIYSGDGNYSTASGIGFNASGSFLNLDRSDGQLGANIDAAAGELTLLNAAGEKTTLRAKRH